RRSRRALSESQKCLCLPPPAAGHAQVPAPRNRRRPVRRSVSQPSPQPVPLVFGCSTPLARAETSGPSPPRALPRLRLAALHLGRASLRLRLPALHLRRPAVGPQRPFVPRHADARPPSHPTSLGR